MIKSNALIILDWDDTLFPTTWILENRIDLADEKTIKNYIISFSELDLILYKLLTNFMNCGTVVIVTNAMVKWVILSSSVLPNARNLIKNKIPIISAREAYQKNLPDDTFAWKRLIFKNLVKSHYRKQKIQNIISVGDADYEFKALVNLWDKQRKRRILKTVKLMQSPSYESLVDQLEVLNKSVDGICSSNKHMDLKFDTKNFP